MDLCVIDWLPEPDVVMNRCRAAAAADVLLSSDVDLRQYWCEDAWRPGRTMAHHHDGAGSHSFVVQSADTLVIKVCMSRRSMGPDPLARFQRSPDVAMPPLAIEVLNEPDLHHQEMSFLTWKQADSPWQGLEFRVDGITSIEMAKSHLKLVCQGAKGFYVYAQTYHEVTIDPPSLMELFKLKPLDKELAGKIAPGANLDGVRAQLEAIGYPLA